MLKNYLLITIRGLYKNRLFVLINVFGMGIAIACCLVGYFANEYNNTYDAIHTNGASIYRVTSQREFEGTLTRYGLAPMPVGNIVSRTMPDVSHSTRMYYSNANFKLEDDVFGANLRYVDPDFFSMFSFDFVAGSPAGLKDPTSVYLSVEVAERLFHSAGDALGKTVSMVYGGSLKELKVAGVFQDPPMNSSFYFKNGSSYVNFDNHKDEFPYVAEDDWKSVVTLFVQIDDASRVAKVHEQLLPLVERNNEAREDFKLKDLLLEQLPGMAIRDRLESTQAWTFVAPPQSAVLGSAVMGVLMLLLACVNLTNSSIAISSRRLREIGIRKVMGSPRQHLIIQFIGETTIVCLIALVVGLGFADLLIGGWNYLWEYMQLKPHYFDSWAFIAFLVGLLAFSGIAAGSYPALYISKFEPVKILKGKMQFGGASFFTRALLTFQFAISLIAVVSAIAFYQNAVYQRSFDLGFNARGGIVVDIGKRGEFDTYRTAIEADPHVLSVAGSRHGIFSGGMREPIRHAASQLEVDIIEVGDRYLETMNLSLVAGRDFAKDSQTDLKESVIISQKLADQFGWKDAIGKEIVWRDSIRLFVVGMIKNVYTQGLWLEMEPMMIRYIAPEDYTQLTASTTAADVPIVNQVMKSRWNELFPNRLYNGNMMVNHLHEVDGVNKNLVYMYGFLGMVALLLSLTGLFSLLSLNIIRRFKEIGVRKVLGASVVNIARIINFEFFVILLIASVVGSFLGYNITNLLMSTIWKYYQPVNLTTVFASVSLLFAMALATVGQKVFSIATMNPVKSLKEE